MNRKTDFYLRVTIPYDKCRILLFSWLKPFALHISATHSSLQSHRLWSDDFNRSLCLKGKWFIVKWKDIAVFVLCLNPNLSHIITLCVDQILMIRHC